jgi:L-alanine-DL-glutamate epimerase-like enolase superfamily enzyme
VTLRTSDQSSHSEATPLEGYGSDTLQQAVSELQRTNPERALSEPSDRAALETLQQVASASARFALECAVLELRAKRDERSLEYALAALYRDMGGSPKDGPYRSVALVSAQRDLHHQLERARREHAAGFKLKIGAEPDQEIAFARALRAALHAEETLRLDANGSLHSEAALVRFAELQPEFVEEPFATAGAPRALPLPIALDETLFRDAETARAWLGHVRAVVLKPMTLGLLGALRWAALAERAGAWVVVSHCFDGSLAACVYESLARVVATPGVAMGLGAHPALALWREKGAAT